MPPDNLQNILQKLLTFRDERDWQRFHSLRHLIVSLNLEAAEVLELTQWQSDDDLKAMLQQVEGKTRLAEECADVLMYLLLLCDTAKIDLLAATEKKLLKNAEKYPIASCKGSSKKHKNHFQ